MSRLPAGTRATHAREAAFHDEIARSLRERDVRPADHLERALWEQLGDVAGMKVLELGCGHGDLTIQLLDAGAEVVATDLSAGMTAATRERIARHRPGARADVLTVSAEATGLPAGSFDLVVGKWVIHHLDVAAAVRETERVLRPGGTAAFIENSSLNPVLRFARDRLVGRFGIPRLGSLDEHPLGVADFELFKASFATVRLVWPDFYFVRLLDRQVFRQRWSWLTAAARRADDLVYVRIPRLRARSFHVIVVATKG